MEFFSPEFWSALFAIIIIDLVLAGDNAIVIALAARNVPAHLRKKAIIWGTVGAIAVRSSMTMIVVWLLKIPGLMLVGGLLLIWIAYKLLIDKSDGEAHTVDAGDSFWGAMKTIVIADAVMGLDNVLAVAGASQGSFLLVILGLLISIPIVIWGSQLILTWTDRFPSIIYVGAGVLAWTAAQMISGEPMLKEFLAHHQWVSPVVYSSIVAGVLGCGFWVNYGSVRSKVIAHLVEAAVGRSVPDASATSKPVLKVLVPVDGSANSLQAVLHAVNQHMHQYALNLHLLHVRTPFSVHVARFLKQQDIDDYQKEQAEKALRSARELLDDRRVPYIYHVEVGDKVTLIAELAGLLQVDKIVMGTARRNSLTRLVEDSITIKVIDHARVPVQVIAGNSVSLLERCGVVAGIGAALVVLLLVNHAN